MQGWGSTWWFLGMAGPGRCWWPGACGRVFRVVGMAGQNIMATVHLVAGQGALWKFVLSPGPKLGGLEQVSSQENSWSWHTANRLGSKCLCSFASHRCPCAYAGVGGRKMGNSSSLAFAEVPQYAPKSVWMNLSHICPMCCVSCYFYVVSLYTAISLRVETKPPLAVLAHTVDSADPWSSRLQVPLILQIHGIQPLWYLKLYVMGITLPCVSSLVNFSVLTTHSTLPHSGSLPPTLWAS